MNIPVIPVADKLIVIPIPKEEIELESKLVIGESDLEKGKVVSVSKEINVKLREFGEEINPGDIVFFPEKKPIAIMIDGKQHLWMQLSDIWGIETNGKKLRDKGDGL